MKMPFISPFLILLCETLGKSNLCPLPRVSFLFESRSSLPVKKHLDISLCGIVSTLLSNIMVFCTHNVISLQTLEGRGGPQGFSIKF